MSQPQREPNMQTTLNAKPPIFPLGKIDHGVLCNNSGLVLSEFLFSFIVSIILCSLIYMMAFSFSITEIVQYMAYSTSRAASAADLNPTEQEANGQRKFDSFKKDQLWRFLFDSDWFTVGTPQFKTGKDESDYFRQYEGPNSEVYQRIPPTGVIVPLELKLLSKDFPFLGSTYLEDPEEFSANITAFLFREPSTEECQDLNIKRRMPAIMGLDSRFSNGSSQLNSGTADTGYAAIEDNGC